MLNPMRFHPYPTTLLLLAAVTIQCPLAMAAAVPQFQCPPSVPISIVPEEGRAPGWKPYIDSALYLNSATPIDGPPQMHGDLADFRTLPGKKEWSYVYDLDRKFPDGKWLLCGYGAHDEATLFQRMPDTIGACTFTYSKGQKAGQHNIKISCR